jgi:hypothetical protein
MRPICSALAENNSATGQIAISPVGTAENSPGRTRISCEVGGVTEPRAAFRKESRIRRRVQSSVQEIRGSPG